MNIEKLLLVREITEELIDNLIERLERIDKEIDTYGYDRCDGCGKFVHGNEALLKGTTRSYVIMCSKCYHKGA